MSQYRVYITPAAWREVKHLPGNMRQRVRKAVDGLRENPRPSRSKPLQVSGIAAEVRRIRMDRWRIVYAIVEEDQAVDVLAVRKRPPYDYGDLESLLKDYPAK